MMCEKCSRETDENCKSCPEYKKLEKERENKVSLLLLKCREESKLYNKIGNIIYKELGESNAYLNLVCTYVVLKLKEENKPVENEPVEKYRNACGSCKYFEQAEITNKQWRKCQSVYKRGVHAGENRICYESMNKCCDYVRKEEKHDENN